MKQYGSEIMEIEILGNNSSNATVKDSPFLINNILIDVEDNCIVLLDISTYLNKDFKIDCEVLQVTINDKYILKETCQIKLNNKNDIVKYTDFQFSHELVNKAYKKILNVEVNCMYELKVYIDEETFNMYKDKYNIVEV